MHMSAVHNIVRLPDANGQLRFYDFGTKNESFLLTAKELRSLGIKCWYWMLEVKNPHFNLSDIDPYDPKISADDIGKILIECKQNPLYFFREVMKVPVRGAGRYPMLLRRSSAASIWCFLHSIDFLLNTPRQLQKTTWITAIITYMFLFEYRNIEIPYMHTRQDRCIENAEMLRDYITSLPPYLNPWYGQTKLPGVKSLKYNQHNVSITLLASADSPTKARDKMRGMTLFSCFLDEWEYVPFIDSVLEGATPAIISGRNIMRQSGGRTCMMFASTPGDLETTTGKAAQKIIDMTPRFSEQLYDFNDQDLSNFFEGVTHLDENGNPVKVTMLYIEYYYFQLRQNEVWLNEQYHEALRLNKLAEYRRGILLQRFRGSGSEIFKQEDIDYLNQNVKQPDHEIMLLKKYILYVYNHEILVPDINSQVPYFDMSIPYMIGIDVAAGGEGDNTTLCIVHPYTLQIVGEIISPYMGILDLMRVITQIAKMLPKCIFCVETNNCGKAIVDFVQESQLESRFYFDPKLDLTKNVTEKDNVDLSLKRKAKNKKYIGTYVTPKVRHNMFELLIMYVKEYRHLLLAKYLVKDIGNLVKDKSGKIAAADGEHDDMVMAYLHVLYVLNYGYDLTRFGIDKTLCTYEKGKRIVDEYENQVAEETIDNTVPYGQPTMYEDQLLHDIIDSQEFDKETGIDTYGYTRQQYNQRNQLDPNPVETLSRGDMAFFREVNQFY